MIITQGCGDNVMLSRIVKANLTSGKQLKIDKVYKALQQLKSRQCDDGLSRIVKANLTSGKQLKIDKVYKSIYYYQEKDGK